MRIKNRNLHMLVCGLLALTMSAALLFAHRPAIERWSWERAGDPFYTRDIDAISENCIILAGNGILQYNGLWWRYTADPLRQRGTGHEGDSSYNPPPTWVYDVEVWDRTHIYAACYPEGILRYNGLRWTAMPGSNESDASVKKLWAQNASSVFAVNEDLELLHYDGRVWSRTPLPNRFGANYVGGNDDCVMVLGETREGVPDILVESDGVWQLADIQPFLENVEPDQGCIDSPYCEYSLRPNKIWPLQDGRILVRVSWKIDYQVTSVVECPFLLCYQDGLWSTIEAPNDSWYPTHITTDDEGYLLVYADQGDRYRQIASRDGSELAWLQLEGEWPGRILGASVLLNRSELLVHGGIPYEPVGVLDASYLLAEPFTLELYELEW